MGPRSGRRDLAQDPAPSCGSMAGRADGVRRAPRDRRVRSSPSGPAFRNAAPWEPGACERSHFTCATAQRPGLRASATARRQKVGKVQPFEAFPNPAGPHGRSARAPPPDFRPCGRAGACGTLNCRRTAGGHTPPPSPRPRAAERPERETDLHPLQNIVPAKSGKFLGRDQFARLRLERALPLFRPWALPEPRRRISGEAFLLRPDLPRRTIGVHESASP